MTELLRQNRVIVCAGTGGVGKTSMSASLAVLSAKAGLRTLVLTIDPAQRLAQALGVEKGDEVAVPGHPNLFASLIDARREFDQFVLGSVDNLVAKSLFDNPLYQQLASQLNGSQEFTSLVRLTRAAKSGRYDLVILDTPPAQNAVDFLRAPERLMALFQETVIGWFANPTRDENWVKRALHRGTRLVTSALETLTGSQFIQELKDFFTHIAYLKDHISSVSREAFDLLHKDSTSFILVTGFDETKLKEAIEFQADLRSEQLKLSAVIVNRWFPEWSTVAASAIRPEWLSHPNYKRLEQFHEQFAEHFKAQNEAFDKFRQQLGKSIPVLKLPDYKNAVQGLADLETVALTLDEKWRSLE